jgi:hypothetical protein
LEHYGKDEPDLLNEAYMGYYWIMGDKIKLTQNEFINKCKTDLEFSERWGLTIEERELSDDERFRIAYKNLDLRKELEAQSKMLHYPDGHNKAMDEANIPTKLITITYNDKTIESYEQ